MFVQILNQIADQICRKYPNPSNSVSFYLEQAIKLWCDQLTLSQNISDYIIRGYNQIFEI